MMDMFTEFQHVGYMQVTLDNGTIIKLDENPQSVPLAPTLDTVTEWGHFWATIKCDHPWAAASERAVPMDAV